MGGGGEEETEAEKEDQYIAKANNEYLLTGFIRLERSVKQAVDSRESVGSRYVTPELQKSVQV